MFAYSPIHALSTMDFQTTVHIYTELSTCML